jgi:hypothetical protein
MPKKSRSTKGRRRNYRRKSTKNVKKGGNDRFSKIVLYNKCDIDGDCGYNLYTSGIKQYFKHIFPNGGGLCTNGCGCSNK